MKKTWIIAATTLLIATLAACGLGGDDAARVSESANVETVTMDESTANPADSPAEEASPAAEETEAPAIEEQGETGEEAPAEAATGEEEAAATDDASEANDAQTPPAEASQTEAPQLSSEVPEAYKRWVPSSAINVTVNEADGNVGITFVLNNSYATVKNHYEKLLAESDYAELTSSDEEGIWIYHAEAPESKFLYITVSDMTNSCFITLSFSRS